MSVRRFIRPVAVAAVLGVAAVPTLAMTSNAAVPARTAHTAVSMPASAAAHLASAGTLAPLRTGEGEVSVELAAKGVGAAEVIDFLRSQGVRAGASGRSAVLARGPMSVMEDLFGATVHSTTLSAYPGKTFYTHTGTLGVPIEIADVASGAVGLSDVPLTTSAVAYTPSQIAQAYGGPRSNSTGAGVTVAIVGFEPWDPTDAVNFANQNGITLAQNQIQTVSTDGTADTTPVNQGSSEVAADVEAVLATAPQATIRVYEAANTGSGSGTLWDYLASNASQFQIISDSFTSCENLYGSDGVQFYENDYSTIAAAHVTMIGASGDNGAYGCSSPSSTGNVDSVVNVEYPASSTYFVAVGGTTLVPNQSETAWGYMNANTSGQYRGAGSGGGVSSIFNRPSYQDNVPNASAMRMVPDISLLADPNYGFAFYSGARGGVGTVGGTSVSAPLFAGFLAGVESSAGITTGLGDIHATLYNHPGDFRDILVGNNGVYSAATGYDEVTGLGSPIISSLAKDLAPSSVNDTNGSGGTGWTATNGGTNPPSTSTGGGGQTTCTSNCGGTPPPPVTTPTPPQTPPPAQPAPAYTVSVKGALVSPKASRSIVRVTTVNPRVNDFYTLYVARTDGGNKAFGKPVTTEASSVTLATNPGGIYQATVEGPYNTNSSSWSVPFDDKNLSKKGHFSTVKRSGAYQGSVEVSNAVNANMTLKAFATSMYVGYACTPDSGIVRIYIDKKLKKTANLYCKKAKDLQSLSFKGLKRGTHTLEILVTNTRSSASKGTKAYIDAVTTSS